MLVRRCKHLIVSFSHTSIKYQHMTHVYLTHPTVPLHCEADCPTEKDLEAQGDFWSDADAKLSRHMQMDAVREAYADMHSTAEAVQAQLAELQATEKDLRRQVKSSTQQVCAAAMLSRASFMAWLAPKEGPAVLSVNAGLSLPSQSFPAVLACSLAGPR